MITINYCKCKNNETGLPKKDCDICRGSGMFEVNKEERIAIDNAFNDMLEQIEEIDPNCQMDIDEIFAIMENTEKK